MSKEHFNPHPARRHPWQSALGIHKQAPHCLRMQQPLRPDPQHQRLSLLALSRHQPQPFHGDRGGRTGLLPLSGTPAVTTHDPHVAGQQSLAIVTEHGPRTIVYLHQSLSPNPGDQVAISDALMCHQHVSNRLGIPEYSYHGAVCAQGDKLFLLGTEGGDCHRLWLRNGFCL